MAPPRAARPPSLTSAHARLDAQTAQRIVNEIDAPALTDTGRAVIEFSRNTVRYEPRRIQEHARRLRESLTARLPSGATGPQVSSRSASYGLRKPELVLRAVWEAPRKKARDRMEIFDYFRHVQIINLPHRTDRREEMAATLRDVGVEPSPGRIEFFDAHRPTRADARGWPSAGACGCFRSHLDVLRRARDSAWPRVLVMEDDLVIDSRFVSEGRQIVDRLESQPWDLVHFAYRLIRGYPEPSRSGSEERDAVSVVPYPEPVMTTSFYAVASRLYTPLIAFLDDLSSRPPGHPDGGPMHIDGAYWRYRRDRPDVRAFVSMPVCGWQRSSPSDVSRGWKDDVPGVRTVVQGLRHIRGRLAAAGHRRPRAQEYYRPR